MNQAVKMKRILLILLLIFLLIMGAATYGRKRRHSLYEDGSKLS